MKTKLDTLYKDVINGYNSISGWWSSYNDNVGSLENVLSNDGRNGDISEIRIRNYVNSRLRVLNTSDEEQILKNYNKFFPDNWELEYSIDKKIQFISIAIKNNQNLKNIVDDYLQDDNIIR